MQQCKHPSARGERARERAARVVRPSDLLDRDAHPLDGAQRGAGDRPPRALELVEHGGLRLAEGRAGVAHAVEGQVQLARLVRVAVPS